MPVAMFDNVAQGPRFISQAHLVHSSKSSQQTDWQDTSGRQASADAASNSYGSPRAPESARLSAHSNGPSSEFLRSTKIPRAHGSPRECSEQNLPQNNPLHNEQMESGIRHLGQNTPRHVSRDPEKGYSEQSPRRANGHCPSRPHHTTIYYEKDDTPDGSAAEEHSVWILVS